jgi:hypothetical protein
MQLPAPAKQLARLYSGVASDRRRNCTRLHRGGNDALLLSSRPSPALPNRSHYLDLHLRHWIAPNIHYLNLSITGASFCIRRQRLNGSIVFETRHPQRSPYNGKMEPPRRSRLISKSLQVHTCSRKPLLARSYLKAIVLALHLFGISQDFLRGYRAPQYHFDGHHHGFLLSFCPILTQLRASPQVHSRSSF